MAEDGVQWVSGPMCNWGMKVTDREGTKCFVRKETGWLTNCPRLAELLGGVCANARGGTWHRHVHLIGGGLAHAAREYPPPLVGAVLQALKEELLARGELNELSAHTSGPIQEEPEMPDGLWMEAWDDVNGGYLDPVEVKKARATEINWVREQKIYEIVPRQTCYNETGKAPISLLWIDTNKGDEKHFNYRSRMWQGR